ncbi:MAG: DUF1329 domain-containing protein [Stenotrophobium sp.]
MKISKLWTVCAALAASVMSVHPALAKVGAAQAAQLGGDKYTCMGAERAGNADGTIPAFSGKWSETYPGYNGPGKYSAGPYADEKPLFTITAQNMKQYAGKLTAGEQALLTQYPQSYRIPVYASHRDFYYSKQVCDIVKDNAAKATVVHDGLGIDATAGAPAFPFPQSGIEAQWNMVTPHRAWTEEAVLDQAVVYADGNKAWGKVVYKILSETNDLRHIHSTQDRVDSYFYSKTLLPARSAGELYVGWNPSDYHNNDRQTWFYSPGTRRVRQAPEFGFDTPQGAGGLRTVDDDRLFNGSPERYDWKLVGKREIYVPYNGFKLNDPSIHYDQLLTANSINPQDMRYELHRVWVLEADLKPNFRHVYKHRVFYLDEDSRHALWVDNYDQRDQLWRASFVNYFWSPEIRGYHAGVSVYHDLSARAYFADRLVNESGHYWQLNQGELTADMFSPDAAQRRGH